MTQEEKDILIAKIICGEASAEELECSNQLLLSDPSYKLIWEKSHRALSTIQEQPTFDTHAAWLKMKNQIHQKSAKRIQLPSLVRSLAAALLVIGIGTLLYFQMQQKKKGIAIQTTIETKKEQLPDGSMVALNNHSSIQYQFNANKRTIHLKGEAFFEVKHDDSKPFIIEVDDLKITDIGTAFLVREKEEEKTIYIGVEEGIVRIEKDELQLELQAGEQAIYHVETGVLEKGNKQNKIRPIYASRILHFNRTPLEQAIQDIQNMYQLDIEIGSKYIKNCEITATFTDENPDIILQVICETLHLDLNKTNNHYFINGVGCNQP
ncbi:MAG: FecR family protein [Bacteroidia bacterium]